MRISTFQALVSVKPGGAKLAIQRDEIKLDAMDIAYIAIAHVPFYVATLVRKFSVTWFSKEVLDYY